MKPLAGTRDTPLGMSTEVLDLREQSLLARARLGEAGAAALLWSRERDALWAIAGAALPREAAIDALAELRGGLVRSLRGARSWRPLVFGGLWAILWRELALPPLAAVRTEGRWPPLRPPPAGARPPGGAALRRAVAEAPAELRLIYLFDLFSGCSARELAGFARCEVRRIHRARAAMCAHLIGAAGG